MHSTLAEQIIQVDQKLFECSRKTKYPLESMAERDAERTTKEAGKSITTYKCRFCDGWHIGNDPANNVQVKEEVERTQFVLHRGMTLAKIKEDLYQYVFAVPAGTPENAQAVLDTGVLVAYKKGRDCYRENNGKQSRLYSVFFNIAPFYTKDLARFRELTENYEHYMVDLESVRMDTLNGIAVPGLAERVTNARADQRKEQMNEQQRRDDQQKAHQAAQLAAQLEEQRLIAGQEMYHGRAVFRNVAGLKPHYRDLFSCVNGCAEKIELRSYISTTPQGELSSVGVRVAVDSAAIRKAGGNRLKPEWICGACVGKMSNPAPAPLPAPAATEAQVQEAKDLLVPPKQTVPMKKTAPSYEIQTINDRILDDLERITPDSSFDDAFVRGAMMMAFKLMNRGGA